MRLVKTGIALAAVFLLMLTLWVPLSQGAQPPPYTRLVSRTSGGVPGNAISEAPSVSTDGRFVAFHSNATDLVANDTNSATDIFVYDRFLSVMERISVATAGTEGDGNSRNPAISPDGRWVAFDSVATNLVAGDTNGRADVFLHDRQTDQTFRISVGPGGAQAVGGDSTVPDISSNGDKIVYQSSATNLIANDGNNFQDIFMYTRAGGTTQRISVSQVNAATPPNGNSTAPRISANGQFVTFASVAENLVANDDNDFCGVFSCSDIFVRNLNAATTEMVSLRSDELQGNQGSGKPGISSDGRWVVFESDADNFDTVISDTNFVTDIFLRDRTGGMTTRVSLGAGNVEGMFPSINPTVSDDGNWIAFSTASALVGSDTNGFDDIYRRTWGGVMMVASLPEGGGEANGSSDDADITGDGQRVVFWSYANNLQVEDTNNVPDVYIRTYLEDDATPTPTNTVTNTPSATATVPTSTPSVTPSITTTQTGGPPTLTPTGGAVTRTPTVTRTPFGGGDPVIFLPVIRRSP